MSEQNSRESQMSVLYLTNGDPERLPKIGDFIPVKAGSPWKFKVENYGESREISQKIYEIELKGCLVLPAGSPIEFLDKFFEGGEF